MPLSAVVIDLDDTLVVEEGAAGALVLEQLGVQPEAALMVGDSWERDIVGAKQAGLSAVWVRGDQGRSARGPGVPSITAVGNLSRWLDAAGRERTPPPGER